MVNVSLKNLVGIASVGGIVIGLTGLTLHRILQNRVLDSPVYKEAMNIINNHPVSDKFLGRPVNSSSVDVRDPNNVLSLKWSTLKLPVYGPKCKALLYVWADRMSAEDRWNVYKLEMEVLDELGGKISILDKEPVLNSTI